MGHLSSGYKDWKYQQRHTHDALTSPPRSTMLTLEDTAMFVLVLITLWASLLTSYGERSQDLSVTSLILILVSTDLTQAQLSIDNQQYSAAAA